MSTREQALDKQREYVEEHSECHHLIACAITAEDRERAIEIIRSGRSFDSALAAAALCGPCTRPGE